MAACSCACWGSPRACTGAVPGAVRLVKADQVRVLAIPMPSGAVWRRRITVLVGANTISSGEVLAALRRHVGATVLGEQRLHAAR